LFFRWKLRVGHQLAGQRGQVSTQAAGTLDCPERAAFVR
jgi:hypothetical protein